MKRIQQKNFARVAEIDSYPTIYEELGNGELRVVDPVELGILKSIIPAAPNLSIDNASLNPRRRDPKTSKTIFGPQEFGSLKIHEESADGKLRPTTLPEFGNNAGLSRKPTPSLG